MSMKARTVTERGGKGGCSACTVIPNLSYEQGGA